MRALLVIMLLAGTALAEPPKVVTQAWLRGQLRSKLPILDDIDRDVGLISMTYLADTGDDAIPSRIGGERLCGRRLARALPALRERMLETLRGANRLVCHNRPGPAWCSFHLTEEYANGFAIVLRRRADGRLVPDAVIELDMGSTNERADASLRAWIDGEWQHQRTTDCEKHPLHPPAEHLDTNFKD